MEATNGNKMGKVVQVMGPVIDVEFKEGGLPPIYTALKLTNPLLNDEQWNLIVEVAQQLGKLQLPAGVRSFIGDGCRRLGADLLGIDLTHLDALSSLPPLHRDPFDRLLVAQAQADRMRLMSFDAAVARYDVALVPMR